MASFPNGPVIFINRTLLPTSSRLIGAKVLNVYKGLTESYVQANCCDALKIFYPTKFSNTHLTKIKETKKIPKFFTDYKIAVR